MSFLLHVAVVYRWHRWWPVGLVLSVTNDPTGVSTVARVDAAPRRLAFPLLFGDRCLLQAAVAGLSVMGGRQAHGAGVAVVAVRVTVTVVEKALTGIVVVVTA